MRPRQPAPAGRLGDLGLPAEQLRRHIAWDVGAEDLAESFARRYGARAVLAGYSRLAIDLNRYPQDPQSIAPASDGTPVPGNHGLGPAERERRVAEIFAPYHARVARELDTLGRLGLRPLVFSVHTMTNRLGGGAERPQQITVCSVQAEPWALLALDALHAAGDIVVGHNRPYAVDLGIDYTVPEHAIRRGLPWLQIEFRQDLVATPAAAQAWADRFAPALERVLEAVTRQGTGTAAE
ncbi:MAG: N-formylglutamate amidohydrolase [Alphaproteobacteria bacterium]